MVKVPKTIWNNIIRYLQIISNNHIHGDPNLNNTDLMYCPDCKVGFGDDGLGKHKEGCLQGAAEKLLSNIEKEVVIE